MGCKNRRNRINSVEKRKIALDRLAGKKTRDIAAAVGVAPSTIQHIIAEPDNRAYAEKFAEKQVAALEKAYEDALQSACRDLKAPEYQARSAARSAVLAFIEAADRAMQYRVQGDNSKRTAESLDEIHRQQVGGTGEEAELGDTSLPELLIRVRRMTTPTPPADPAKD